MSQTRELPRPGSIVRYGEGIYELARVVEFHGAMVSAIDFFGGMIVFPQRSMVVPPREERFTYIQQVILTGRA